MEEATKSSTAPSTLHEKPEEVLYARAAQKRILLDGLKEVISTLPDPADNITPTKEEPRRRKFILVSGQSGTGKSVLCRSLRVPAQEAGGHFLQGKFDQFQQTSSQNVVASAIGQYAARIGEDKALVQHIRQELGRDIRCLVDMIPALVELFPETQELDDDSDTKTNGWMEDMTTLKTRTRRAFLKFISIVCSPNRPLVLFLDDLQWASKDDYQIIQELLTTTAENIEGLLLVGACRTVDKNHRLSLFIQGLAKIVPITDVVLSNMSSLDVQMYLVSAYPKMEPEDAEFLAATVKNVTDGNFFFVKQYLASLLDQDLLMIQNGDMVSLDKARLEKQTNSDDVLNFIVANLRLLAPEVQSLLQAASCLGARFGLSLLECVVPPESLGKRCINEVVEECSTKGILSLKTTTSETKCSFSHDQLQQASYMLIPEDNQPAFHLSIGRSLRDRMNEKELEKHISLVTSHIIHGADLIESQSEKDQVAALCLLAGQKSAAQFNFDDAGSYIDAGLGLLGDDKWNNNYELCLRLFNAGAEITIVRVEFHRLEELVSEVQRNAKSFEDTIESRTTYIYALGSRQKLSEAIDEGLKVLEKLGEQFPKIFSLYGMRYEHLRTKRRLAKYTDRGLLGLPAMKDTKKLAAMRVLNLLFAYTFWNGDARASLITYRSIQISLDHGLCAMSGVSFSFFAGYLCFFGEIDAGNRYGEVALRIVDRFRAKLWSARVKITVNSFVKPWKYPIGDLLENNVSASTLSFAVGDTEYAMLGRGMEVTYRFKLGFQLGSCYQAALDFQEQLRRNEQNVVLSIFQPFLQKTANLYGKSKDPFVLTGDFMDEGKSISAAKENNRMLDLGILYLAKAVIAFYLNDFELAADCAKQSRCLKQAWNMQATMCYMQIFVEGMAYLVSEKPNIRAAKSCLKELRAFASVAPTALSVEINLLEAELASLKGNDNEAHEKFEMAIAFAQRHGVIHEQAFACERASRLMWKLGRAGKAAQYLDEALDLYKLWGCDLKVKQIEKQKASVQ